MSCARTTFPLALLASVLLLNVSAATEPEMWLCKRADGTEIFTNKTKGLTDCRPYAPRSELGYMKGTAPKPLAPPSQPQAPTGPPITINIVVNMPAPPPAPAAPPTVSVGEIPFEVSRMLSVGMSEAEVLRRAGLPQTTLAGPYAFGFPYSFWPVFGANRFVYSSGDWLVEVTFSGGRVSSINQFRPRP
jgi:hypothetical protein